MCRALKQHCRVSDDHLPCLHFGAAQRMRDELEYRSKTTAPLGY
jgi:hypothetical protein